MTGPRAGTADDGAAAAWGAPAQGPSSGSVQHGTPAPDGGFEPAHWQTAQGSGPSTPGDAQTCLATAASRAGAVSVVIGVQAVAWLIVAVSGVILGSVPATFDARGETAAVDREVLSDALGALGLLAVAALVVVAYVLLGVWTSWSARAERAVVGSHAAGRSGRAWWGWFVPLANVILPYHAYSDAAASVSEAQSGVRKVPVLLTCWWMSFGAAVLGLGFADNSDALGRDYGYEGGVVLVVGVIGFASSVLGVLAFRGVAASSRRVVADRWDSLIRSEAT